MPQTKDTLLLAGDIGGTNSRLALYFPPDEAHSSPRPFYPPASADTGWKEYLNETYGSFDEVLATFLADSGLLPPSPSSSPRNIIACLACAGPVADNAVAFTNESGNQFRVDGDALAADPPLGVAISSCTVVNDFVGAGYGTLTLDRSGASGEVRILNGAAGDVRSDGVVCCVGAGTGLGECFLTPGSSGGYVCYPSEGGHKDLSSRSSVEFGAQQHIVAKYGPAGSKRCSIERVASGTGIANVYEYLAKVSPERADAAVKKELAESLDSLRGKVIGTAAKKGTCGICVETMEIFASAYGAEVGNVACQFIPHGGIFVCGGLTPKNMHLIEGPGSPFMTAYNDKGRLSKLVKDIPVFAVMVEDLGLRGARYVAAREYSRLVDGEPGNDEAVPATAATEEASPSPKEGNPYLWAAGGAAAALALVSIFGKKR